MKSPFTGGKVRLQKESRTLEFRKDSFDLVYHYFVCEDTGEQFTTAEIDDLNIEQVHNKYRTKYGIPFADEIRAIREKYGLSAAKMSEVLGLGVNIYRNYEAGEMPSVATGRLIRMAEDPKEFDRLLEIGKNALEHSEYDRVRKKITSTTSFRDRDESYFLTYIFGFTYPNLYTGFRVPNTQKINQMIWFFAFKNKPFVTAFNKLLFYSDFYHFKQYGHSISGLYYKALPKGPVPGNYGSLYNYAANKGFIRIEEVNYGDYVGEQLIAEKPFLADDATVLFNETELAVLQRVSKRFLGLSTKKIVEISHEEPAWQDNVGEFNRISFEYAFELRNME